MNVFYEEEGSFKVGAVLADNDTSLQVEAPHGKRSKVKASNVLFRFNEPLSGFMEGAQKTAEEVDLELQGQAAAPMNFHSTPGKEMAARRRRSNPPRRCSNCTARRCISTSAAKAAIRPRLRTPQGSARKR
jgi:hypothetical protein